VTAQPDTAQEIALRLQQFVAEEILADGSIVDPEQNLLGEGVVDSLGMLRLVSFIELSYELKISPVQFTIQNFRSISVISSFVAGLRAAADGRQ
jgi:acyl carrier protein